MATEGGDSSSGHAGVGAAADYTTAVCGSLSLPPLLSSIIIVHILVRTTHKGRQEPGWLLTRRLQQKKTAWGSSSSSVRKVFAPLWASAPLHHQQSCVHHHACTCRFISSQKDLRTERWWWWWSLLLSSSYRSSSPHEQVLEPPTTSCSSPLTTGAITIPLVLTVVPVGLRHRKRGGVSPPISRRTTHLSLPFTYEHYRDG